MRVVWIGHSTVVFEANGTRLVTDPVLRGRVTHLRRVEAVKPAAVGEVDAVLVSHLHYDHLDLPSLASLGASTRLIVPRGAGAWLRRKGFERIAELEPGDEARVGPVVARATEAAHGGNRPLLGARAPALGYLLEAGATRVYFAGDTELFAGMRDLAPGLDLALLPIWGWGPKLGAGHLDPRAAAEALTLLRPRVVVPIHWGTYYRYRPGTRRPGYVSEPVESFRRHAAELAPGVEVRVLGLGDALDVD